MMTMNRSQAPRTHLLRALAAAGLLIAASAALALLSPQHIGEGVARRLLGIVMGAVVVVYANAVPRALTPLVRMRCDPAAEQAIRRFTGWSLVLGGIGYAAAWAFAPLEHARILSIALLGAALLLVVARIAIATARGSRA